MRCENHTSLQRYSIMLIPVARVCPVRATLDCHCCNPSHLLHLHRTINWLREPRDSQIHPCVVFHIIRAVVGGRLIVKQRNTGFSDVPKFWFGSRVSYKNVLYLFTYFFFDSVLWEQHFKKKKILLHLFFLPPIIHPFWVSVISLCLNEKRQVMQSDVRMCYLNKSQQGLHFSHLSCREIII